MPNQLLTSDKITKRAAVILPEYCAVPASVNRQYDDMFASTGGKAGDQIRVRKPPRFTAGTGPVMTSQDIIDEFAYVNTSQQFHVGVEITSKDLTLSLDDFETQILRPAMATLGAKIDQYCFEVLNANCGAAIVGSGSGQAVTWKDIVKAGAYLDQQEAPNDSNRNVLINPLTQVNVLDETKGLFNAAKDISDQYREGMIGRTAGFLFTSSARSPIITVPSDNAGTVNGAYTAGSTTINLSGLAASTVYQAGLVFTVANVFDVHPQTKASLGRLHAFVVRSDFTTDGSGNASGVSIHPVWGSTAGARQNVTAVPANGAAVTFLGNISTSYRQTFAFHRDAFAFATADLVKPEGAVIKVMNGISIRFASSWDGKNDSHIRRFDVLCGIAPVYPELAVKLIEPNI